QIVFQELAFALRAGLDPVGTDRLERAREGLLFGVEPHEVDAKVAHVLGDGIVFETYPGMRQSAFLPPPMEKLQSLVRRNRDRAPLGRKLRFGKLLVGGDDEHHRRTRRDQGVIAKIAVGSARLRIKARKRGSAFEERAALEILSS